MRHDAKVPAPEKSHKSTGAGRTGRPKQPDSIRSTAATLGMAEPTLRRDLAAIKNETWGATDPDLAKLVALWRTASPSTRTAFRQHIGP